MNLESSGCPDEGRLEKRAGQLFVQSFHSTVRLWCRQHRHEVSQTNQPGSIVVLASI